MENKLIFICLILFLSFYGLNSVSAWEFNGTVYSSDGSILNNSLINITIWSRGESGPPSLVGSNSTWSENSTTASNFSTDVSENSSWLYRPVVTHLSSGGYVDYVGQALPQFAYQEISRVHDVNFYLKEAGTINLTVVNQTADVGFGYMVSDTQLGYNVASGTAGSSGIIVYVPKNRNYSIMIWPDEDNFPDTHFVPVTFEWNNFSAGSDYNVTVNNKSTYNSTSHTLNKQFNVTESFSWLSGYLFNSTGSRMNSTNGWNITEFTIVPYIIGGNNMVTLDRGLPFNASAWREASDQYNLTTGFYNISVPYESAENVKYLLYAAVKNSSGVYLGGYRNLTVDEADENINFSIYTLLGDEGIITMSNSAGGNYVVNTSELNFTLINSTTNETLTSLTAHIEFKVDYSSYNATSITFTKDLSNSDGIFSFPLLNVTEVKEINIYTMGLAPKTASKTISELRGGYTNISMSSFNPGARDGSILSSQISISFYKSNSTCDVPNPPSSCTLMTSTNLADFNPLSVIMGGGAISFRMGSGGIFVHYVNVDLLASGPPDGMFDNDAGASESTGSFSNAMKFGSNGPKIYDYALISMPYSTSASTGLDDSQQVNLSIPVFYGEDSSGNLDWSTPIWNVSANGTSGTDLAGNFSHYNDAHIDEWTTLMSNNTCNATTTGTTAIDINYPCHIQTEDNRIWLRLPHFSGTQPSVVGSVVAATADTTTTTSPSGSSNVFWTSTFVISDEQFKEGYSKEMYARQRLKINVDGDDHYVGIVNLTDTYVTINISSNPQQAVFNVGDEKKFDVTDDGYYDLDIKLNSINNSRINITILSIYEKIVNVNESNGSADQGDEVQDSGINGGNLIIKIIIGILIVVIIALVLFFVLRKRRR